MAWDEVRTRFTRLIGTDFSEISVAIVTHKEISNQLRQGTGNVTNYRVEARNLFMKTEGAFNDLTQAHYFMLGLTPTLRDKCLCDPQGNPWKDMDAVAAFALGQEKTQMLISQSKSGTVHVVDSTPTYDAVNIRNSNSKRANVFNHSQVQKQARVAQQGGPFGYGHAQHYNVGGPSRSQPSSVAGPSSTQKGWPDGPCHIKKCQLKREAGLPGGGQPCHSYRNFLHFDEQKHANKQQAKRGNAPNGYDGGSNDSYGYGAGKPKGGRGGYGGDRGRGGQKHH